MKYTHWNRIERWVMERLAPRLNAGHFAIDLDGKIRLKRTLALDVPWVFIRGREFGDCYMLKDVWFETFKIVPSFCQKFCWKVVLKPKTVADLFKLHDIMQALNVIGKCGIERRVYVRGHYGGYIYNNSKEEAMDNYNLINEILKVNVLEMPVSVKRGCTEFESVCPSDKWEVSPDQFEIEKKLLEIFNSDPIPPYQPQWVKNNIKRSWIHHAYKHGDDTYKLCIPAEDAEFYQPSVTYHEQQENEPHGNNFR